MALLTLIAAKLLYYATTTVLFLAVITCIAVIHEGGHHLTAKLCGVRVDEFSIGFGKLLWSKQMGDTLYCIRAIPIAAYVRPAGMNPDEAEEEGYVDPGERSFERKSSLAKHAILFGGSVFNILSAVVFLTVLFAFVGDLPTTIRVKAVGDGSAAQKSGIVVGDIFVDIDGVPVRHTTAGIAHLKRSPGRQLTIHLTRDGKDMRIQVTPDVVDGEGRIGIHAEALPLGDEATKMPLAAAFPQAVSETFQYVDHAYRSALGMVRRIFTSAEVPKDVGGPLSIVGAVGSVVERGSRIGDILRILSMLSLAIGVFNLLPFPALDGGRILVLLVKDVLDTGYLLVRWRRPAASLLTARMEEAIHLTGFVGLLLLLVVVTFKDAKEMVSGPAIPSPAALASPAPVGSASASPLATPVPSPAAP